MTDINGSIKSDIKVLEDIYDVSVDIPTAQPSIANPYKLQIFSRTVQAKLPPTQFVPMMVRLEASYNDGSKAQTPDNVYLELGPPASILPSTDEFAIQNLSIVFATGTYANAEPMDGVRGTHVVEDAPTKKEDA